MIGRTRTQMHVSARQFCDHNFFRLASSPERLVSEGFERFFAQYIGIHIRLLKNLSSN